MPRALVAVASLVLIVAVLTGALWLGAHTASDESSATRTAVASQPAADEAAAPSTTASTTPPTTYPPRDLGAILVVGDSVAYSFSPQLAAEAAARGMKYSNHAVPGCGLFTGLPTDGPGGEPFPIGLGCEKAVLAEQPGLAAERGAGTVVWLSSWEVADRVVNDAVLAFGTPEGDRMTLQLLDEARARILEGSDALLVLVKLAPPAATSRLGTPDPRHTRRVEHLNDLFDEFAASHPIDTRVMDLGAIVCPSGVPCDPVVDGIEPRAQDGGHFTTEGAVWLAPRFLDALIDLAG